jgi:hypothetical protein
MGRVSGSSDSSCLSGALADAEPAEVLAPPGETAWRENALASLLPLAGFVGPLSAPPPVIPPPKPARAGRAGHSRTARHPCVWSNAPIIAAAGRDRSLSRLNAVHQEFIRCRTAFADGPCAGLYSCTATGHSSGDQVEKEFKTKEQNAMSES